MIVIIVIINERKGWNVIGKGDFQQSILIGTSWARIFLHISLFSYKFQLVIFSLTLSSLFTRDFQFNSESWEMIWDNYQNFNYLQNYVSFKGKEHLLSVHLQYVLKNSVKECTLLWESLKVLNILNTEEANSDRCNLQMFYSLFLISKKTTYGQRLLDRKLHSTFLYKLLAYVVHYHKHYLWRFAFKTWKFH